MIKIIHKPINMLKVCEYAGRTCWQSHEMQKKPTEEFIASLVNIKHESVIEHAHITLKLLKSEFSAGTILRAIENTGDNTNPTVPVATVVETESSWYIGINIRGLKNIVRNTEENNAIRKDIISNVIQQLPHAFFSDFIKSGIIKDYKNSYGADYPYFRPDRKDKFFFLSDLLLLEKEIADILANEPELTIPMVSKLVAMTIRFVAPRWLCTQLIRHRCSTSQESLRYVNARNFGYHIPKSLKGKKFRIARHVLDQQCPQSSQDILEFSYSDLMEFLGIAYEQAIEVHKSKQEDARNMLPLAIDSEIVFTKPMNQWGHTMALRVEKHTQLDTRVLMSWTYLAIADGGFPILNAMIGDLKDDIVWDDLYNIGRNS